MQPIETIASAEYALTRIPHAFTVRSGSCKCTPCRSASYRKRTIGLGDSISMSAENALREACSGSLQSARRTRRWQPRRHLSKTQLLTAVDCQIAIRTTLTPFHSLTVSGFHAVSECRSASAAFKQGVGTVAVPHEKQASRVRLTTAGDTLWKSRIGSRALH